MLFFELLQVALGQRDRLSFNPSQSEWEHLFQLSRQHTVVGVGYQAVCLLPKEQSPEEGVLANWIWQAQRIAERNLKLNNRSVRICEGLNRKGYDACLLKGQGNALMYGAMADKRQPGDVDVWGIPHERPEHQPKRRVIEFVQKKFPKSQLRFHHIDFPVFEGVEVEIHFVPIYLNNPILNHRLNQWYREHREEQMNHRVELEGCQVAVPTLAFNALYQLLHIYKHIFEEGIGLRQLMDYYFVLKALHEEKYDISELKQMIEKLKLERLAGAVMYVLKQAFAMPDDWMIASPRKHEGLLLLSEIMQSGNFGHYDTRYRKEGKGWTAELHRYWRKTKRNLILSYYFPHEGLFEPGFRLYHFFWRTLKLWRI